MQAEGIADGIEIVHADFVFEAVERSCVGGGGLGPANRGRQGRDSSYFFELPASDFHPTILWRNLLENDGGGGG